MNKKTVFAGLLVSALMMTSCQSVHQFYGATTGASIGGIFGSAIGGMAAPVAVTWVPWWAWP